MTSRVHRRDFARLWLGVLALALLARALVPAGWMPLADASGMRLVLCSGFGPVPDRSPASAQHGERHAGADHDGGSGGDHDNQGKADQSAPCTFAASASSEPPPSLAELAYPRFVSAALPFSAFTTVRIGQGLAAPPPPSTGPPPTLR